MFTIVEDYDRNGYQRWAVLTTTGLLLCTYTWLWQAVSFVARRYEAR